MHEHRKGLNRALFWLYSGHGRWPTFFRWSMLVFDLVTIVLFLFHPSISWHGQDVLTTGIWLVIDIFIALVITLDLLARFYIERYKLRFFLRLTNLADILVAATLLIPFVAQNFVFLRVFRVVRLVRAFEFLDHQHVASRWLHYNSFIVSKVVNLERKDRELSRRPLFHGQYTDHDRLRRYHDGRHVGTVAGRRHDGAGCLTVLAADPRHRHRRQAPP
jgi:voltage-gated potassium channel